jgi:hypothetical protein
MESTEESTLWKLEYEKLLRAFRSEMTLRRQLHN